MATKIGLLAQELSQQNPWWRDPGWAARDLDLRDAADTGLAYRPDALDGLLPGCLYILRGPRRVGKTVTVKQQIEQLIATGTSPTTIVRAAVDGWEAKELRTLVQNAALPPLAPGVHRTWLIDEISAVGGDWAQQIKWLRDNNTDFREATVVLTGSNAEGLTAAAGRLAGRRGHCRDLDRTLLPIGFRTFANLLMAGPKPDLPQLDPSKLRTRMSRDAFEAAVVWIDDLVRLWETYLLYGGFPRSVGAAAQGSPIPADFVEDVFHVIAGDAFKNSKLGTTTEVALLERLWTAMAAPANLLSIGTDVGVSRDVVSRHVSYLTDAYLLWRCPQRSERTWLPRERSQPKLYAIDPLVARMAHLRSESRADIDQTVLSEMQIGMALRRAIVRANPTALNDELLFHVRTPARKEIDFVSRDLANAAVEGKYTEGRWKSEAATVGASEWDGILCTRNVLDVSGDGAWAVPAAIVAYLVDT